MDRLFYFIYQYRAFFMFVVLEVFCFWLVVENNHYQGARFFNSSNSVVAVLNSFSQGIRDYFLLRDVNTTLAEENAILRRQLEEENQMLQSFDSLATKDTTWTKRFDFVSAKVVNNHVDHAKNFITINKGENAGLQPGMAVISSRGAVGKVKLVSKHYGVVTSLLHIDVMVSATLKRTGHFGTIQWDGMDPSVVKFKYIPRHVVPQVGDTVVTSGFNAIFPEGIVVGTIASATLRDEAIEYDIDVKLSQDFRQLSYVTVIKSELKHEQDSIERVVNELEK